MSVEVLNRADRVGRWSALPNVNPQDFARGVLNTLNAQDTMDSGEINHYQSQRTKEGERLKRVWKFMQELFDLDKRVSIVALTNDVGLDVSTAVISPHGRTKLDAHGKSIQYTPERKLGAVSEQYLEDLVKEYTTFIIPLVERNLSHDSLSKILENRPNMVTDIEQLKYTVMIARLCYAAGPFILNQSYERIGGVATVVDNMTTYTREQLKACSEIATELYSYQATGASTYPRGYLAKYVAVPETVQTAMAHLYNPITG